MSASTELDIGVGIGIGIGVGVGVGVGVHAGIGIGIGLSTPDLALKARNVHDATLARLYVVETKRHRKFSYVTGCRMRYSLREDVR